MRRNVGKNEYAHLQATGLHVDFPLHAMPTPRPTQTIVASVVFFLHDSSACADLFLPTFRRMPSANAESYVESDGSIGKTSVIHIFRHLQIDTGPRCSPSACSEKLFKKCDGNSSASNGATRIVPGSHISELTDVPSVGHRLERDAIPVIATKGSMMLLNGAAWHGPSDNLSEEHRVILLLLASTPILRPLFDNAAAAMSNSRLMATASPRVRSLLEVCRFILTNISGHADGECRELCRS